MKRRPPLEPPRSWHGATLHRSRDGQRSASRPENIGGAALNRQCAVCRSRGRTKGAWRDNVFVERLWKSVKYEEVYLRAYETVAEARSSIGRSLDFYNATVRIRALTNAPRIKPTSIFLRSARRPNPGSGSAYRRGKSGQTTGTTSMRVSTDDRMLATQVAELGATAAIWAFQRTSSDMIADRVRLHRAVKSFGPGLLLVTRLQQSDIAGVRE